MSALRGSLAAVIVCATATGTALVASGRPQTGNDHTSGDLAGMRVAVTVDDLPAPGLPPSGQTQMHVVEALLAALSDRGVPAWGFVNGYQAEWLPETLDILKAWLLAGYPLGNHGYHHADLNVTPAGAYIDDIERTDQLIESFSPVSRLVDRRRVFRYPYLREGRTPAAYDPVRTYLATHQYRVAQVTVDYLDWAWAVASDRCRTLGDAAAAARLRGQVLEAAEQSFTVARASARQLFGRDIAHILLVHPNAFTADTLPAILSTLQSSGVRFIPLDDALADPVYRIAVDPASRAGVSFLVDVERSRGIKRRPEEYAFSRINTICRVQPPG